MCSNSKLRTLTGRMDGRRDDDIAGARIPVFVFPSSVVFNANDRDHLKQIITIYNPYDFPVRFKVLSTSPANYTVVDPEGSVNAKNSVDLIVRLTSTVPSESSSSSIYDKFRVQLYNYTTRQQLGRKDVTSVIHFADPHSGSYSANSSQGNGMNLLDSVLSPSEAFQQCPSTGIKSSASVNSGVFYTSAGGGSQHYNPNYVAICTALICIVGLMLPTNTNDKDDVSYSSSSIPSYLHLTINQKLLIAYTLGLVTMVIFRPQ